MSYFSEYEKLNKNAEKYEAFYDLLISENEKYNLTAITDKKDVALKHFIDSVYYKEVFKKDALVVEIGSGAGFPSIPLAIEREDLKFTLIEATEKKCKFLKTAVETLKLDNVEVVCKRAEDLAKTNLRESFDIAIARAVAETNTLIEYTLPFLKVGGLAYFWKGESYIEELERAENALNVLGGKRENELSYELDEYGKRYLVIIKKTEKTPPKYPRGHGKERKCPL